VIQLSNLTGLKDLLGLNYCLAPDYRAVRTGSPQRTASPKFSPRFQDYPNFRYSVIN